MIQKDLPYNPSKGAVDTHTGTIPRGEVYVGKLVVPNDVINHGLGISVQVANNDYDGVNCSLSRTPGSFTKADNLRGDVFTGSCSWHGGARGILDAGVWYVNIEPNPNNAGTVDDVRIQVQAQQVLNRPRVPRP